MATKDYSSKQEQSIAKFLGWKVVSGSGARDFHPGDIKSFDYLGECKTHTEQKDRLRILFSVWRKIVDEASSCFKKPILFFDNGTQKLNSTWCVLPKKLVADDTLKSISNETKFAWSKLRISTTGMSFDHNTMKMDIGDGDYAIIKIDGEPLLLMTLFTFKYFILGED